MDSFNLSFTQVGERVKEGEGEGGEGASFIHLLVLVVCQSSIVCNSCMR